jgi:hypothetical protein
VNVRLLNVWLLRAAWLTLPLTAGPAVDAALRSWDAAPRDAAAVLLWLAWATGLLTTFAPRPQTLTAIRVIAPTFFVLAIAAAVDGAPSSVATVGAVVATAVCAVLTSGHDLALAAANSVAYGDEHRFPLRVPPALFLGPLPLARAVVAAAVVLPVLALADGDVLLGVVGLAVGAVVVFVLGRSLHSLSRRWAILVPAGFVVVDPLTLTDPHLFLRERMRRMEALATGTSAPADTLDLRLGATAGSITVEFDEVAEIVRSGRGRRGGETVRAGSICVAVVRRSELLGLAGERRLPVR